MNDMGECYDGSREFSKRRFSCFAAILISLILVHCIGALLPVDSPVGTPSYPISVAVVAVAVSVLTALLGGLLPALKAAKLEPALALR
jgi:putative ABC transport system permease protein